MYGSGNQPGPTPGDLQAIIDAALAAARPACAQGRVASYIPELAKADSNHLGVALHPLHAPPVCGGDALVPFTLQSVSKLFALCYVMHCGVEDLFQRIDMEPSGDAFHSIVLLEQEHGHPRNPFINAGAIVVSHLMPGNDPDEKIQGFQQFLRRITGSDGFHVNPAVYESESRTGYRNRALANYMRHFEVIPGDPRLAVDTYFQQCSLETNAVELARAGLFMANNGVDPITGQVVLGEDDNRTVVALMSLCGLYDQVGEFAVHVGVPAKSGVSGDIIAVVPGRMALSVYGPALGAKGNSNAGMQVLTHLARTLRLSIFQGAG